MFTSLFTSFLHQDVIRGPFPAEDRALFGLNPWGLMFLWANWVSFSMGLGVVACVQIINSRVAFNGKRSTHLAAMESMLLPIEVMTLIGAWDMLNVSKRALCCMMFKFYLKFISFIV